MPVVNKLMNKKNVWPGLGSMAVVHCFKNMDRHWSLGGPLSRPTVRKSLGFLVRFRLSNVIALYLKDGS